MKDCWNQTSLVISNEGSLTHPNEVLQFLIPSGQDLAAQEWNYTRVRLDLHEDGRA